jgi:hypothetical protein
MPPSRSSKAEALLRPPFIREVFTNQIAQNPNRISRAAESEPTTTKTQHHPADHHHLAAREQLRAPRVGKSGIACRYLIKVYSSPSGCCRSAGGHSMELTAGFSGKDNCACARWRRLCSRNKFRTCLSVVHETCRDEAATK